MEIIQTNNGQTAELLLSGRFDSVEANAVKEWFKQQLDTGQKQLLVNLSGVTFIDSTALSVLVQGLKNCREIGAALKLCSLQQPVRIIFELTRLDKAFDIYPTEKDAYPPSN